MSDKSWKPSDPGIRTRLKDYNHSKRPSLWDGFLNALCSLFKFRWTSLFRYKPHLTKFVCCIDLLADRLFILNRIAFFVIVNTTRILFIHHNSRVLDIVINLLQGLSFHSYLIFALLWSSSCAPACNVQLNLKDEIQSDSRSSNYQGVRN